MPSSEVPKLLDQLTVAEKVALLSGRDAWRTAEITHLGIGSVKVTDGPVGARGDGTPGSRSVCLPASIALAASFDPSLAGDVGALIGREVARKGAHVLLAPTVNLARHPLGGRNFESFGEDPVLTATLAVAYVDGVQSEGVGACAKHFVANDVEYGRMTVSSEVSEEVLRENYLLPFEALVEAGVWTVMASYPRLNGTHCSEHHWLLDTVLRDEWGFDGLVMSDWGAVHHPSRPVLAGLDLEMPGPSAAYGPALEAAVAAGTVPVDVLDRRVARVLDLAARAGRLGATDAEPERSVDLPAERDLARRVATEGMVLLANDGTLPLAAGSLGRLAVVGPNAHPGVIQGGGSARVPAHHAVSPFEGLVAALPGVDVVHHRACVNPRYLPPTDPALWVADRGGAGPLLIEQFDDPDLAGEPTRTRRSGTVFAMGHQPFDPPFVAQRWSGTLAVTSSGVHRFGVLAVGRSRVLVDGELLVDNWTDPQPGEAFFRFASTEVVAGIELSAGTEVDVVVEWAPDLDNHFAALRFGHLPPLDADAELTAAVELAAGADAAVVVVGLDHEWETEGHDRVGYDLPGRQAELIRRVAEVNRRTVVVVNAGAPVALDPADGAAAVLMAWYPGQETGDALAEVLLGTAEPGGRLPLTWPASLDDCPFPLPVEPPGPSAPGLELPYVEGHLIGHRSADRGAVEPLFPFGHGLGYTSFALGTPVGAGAVTIDAATIGPTAALTTLTVPVTNTGDRAGRCVVQAYLAWPDDAIGDDRPVRRFVGAAVARPGPGATTEVGVAVPGRAFCRFVEGEGWVAVAGRHRIHVGTSSRDLTGAVDVDVAPVRAGAHR